MRLMGRDLVALLLFAGFAAVPLLANLLQDPFLLVIATRMLAFAIAAMGLDLVLGYGALVSFGHAAYLGIGAYAVTILMRLGVYDIGLHLLAGIAAAVVFAVGTGAVSLRTRGVYFIMITLAFSQMAYFFFVSFSALGGDDGASLPQRSTLFGHDLLENDLWLFWLALGLLIGLFLVCRAIVGSRFGRVLCGARENPQRMQAIGFVPFGYQLTAYVISGAITSIAGVLLAKQAEFVSPALMNWHRSGELIVMVVLGGIGTLSGAIAGAVLALLLEETLAGFTQYWKLWFGLFLVGIVLFAPGGVQGLVARIKLQIGSRR